MSSISCSVILTTGFLILIRLYGSGGFVIVIQT